ncbi:aconitate hydratase AcnA [Candidatus Sumerlaeota bacterium]|nr:aconitate hydratase AcnA [Candidatus Sumerlaeales bacterium]NLD61969.1 aconitate hydratase AcnA [Candidatus Sumerlaeota bacterium]
MAFYIKQLYVNGTSCGYYSIRELERCACKSVQHLPFTLRILLENLLRNNTLQGTNDAAIETISAWNPNASEQKEIAFTPARVILQDFTGVPCIADLAAMRDAVAKVGGDPQTINPVQPADLVIDHSIQVDSTACDCAIANNMKMEFDRNHERYAFLRWGQQAFSNFRVVPPGNGIIHQINVEHLASVVKLNEKNIALFDTVVGTDSHTPMVNGLGVLGWGVGGIEAEAAMLGQPVTMLLPQVVGVHISGKLPVGTTATDLVLTLVQQLRKHGVVGKFVEFFGKGLDALSVPERCVISNMTPEHGATCGYFPVDAQTIEYLALTGRPQEQLTRIEEYCKTQGTWRETDSDTNNPQIRYSQVIEFNLADIVPCIAGPKRPQDRIALSDIKSAWQTIAKDNDILNSSADADQNNKLQNGSVVIAAITSCTNTAAPSLMLGAGLFAKKAVELGLKTKPWVKTSLAPGSHVVTDYLRAAGLLPYLEQLGFNVIGYGCTTCIGNSGPLAPEIAKAIDDEKLFVCSVLSGNRNFEGRINSRCKANWLVSPALVIMYAIKGTIDFDPTTEPIGFTPDNKPVMLADLWPADDEIKTLAQKIITPMMFSETYKQVFDGTKEWEDLPIPTGDQFAWNTDSTYIKEPPFVENFQIQPPPTPTITGARCLAVVGDSVTTDHISPAGNIAKDSPAANYLRACGIEEKDFNSYGSRRGNHEVMARGTFANIRFHNLMLKGTEGGKAIYLPTGEIMSIYQAAMLYQNEKTPLIIIAGKEYGSGSSRDWAAKGPALLGIKMVLAESFERIHRSNLIGMGILPLQFEPGENAQNLGLNGTETFNVENCFEKDNSFRRKVKITATACDGKEKSFTMVVRLDTPIEQQYYINGGILPYMLRQLL